MTVFTAAKSLFWSSTSTHDFVKGFSIGILSADMINMTVCEGLLRLTSNSSCWTLWKTFWNSRFSHWNSQCWHDQHDSMWELAQISFKFSVLSFVKDFSKLCHETSIQRLLWETDYIKVNKIESKLSYIHKFL